jgi:hypothetical protein
MEDIDFKLLQSKAVQERWTNLANKGDWDSILQLTKERINHVYEAFKNKTLMTEQGDIPIDERLSDEELLIGSQNDVLIGNTICACHSLLTLIQILDNDIYKELIEIDAEHRFKDIEQRIEKLEGK